MFFSWYFDIILFVSIIWLHFYFKHNPTYTFYRKYFTYYFWVQVFSIICLPIYVFRPFCIANFVCGAALCKLISRAIGLKWILRGREHLEKQEPGIIVSNHQSSLDILGLFEIWSIMKMCTVVAKKELVYTGPFGLASWLCGIIFIDRVRPGSAKNSVNAATNIIREQKAKLWIFAEGTRRNTGEIHSFKKGAFHMAISAQLPIIPVVCSRYYFVNKKERRFIDGKIIMTALPSISTTGMTINDVDRLLQQTRDAMIKVYEESTKEVLDMEGIASIPAS